MVQTRTKKPPWYKSRRYIHFDTPIQVGVAEALVTNPDAVARRAFWPLISFRQKERRWKREEKRWQVKSRPIAYASHIDSHIFAYYSWMLGAKYETMLVAEDLSDVVLAYRKHTIDPEKSDRGKANFHFAAEAFADIACRTACEVTAIDVAKFFDTIPHKVIKANWCSLIGCVELPKDHYAVYKAATRFACVPLAQIRKSLGIGRRKFSKLRSIDMGRLDFDRLVRERGIINTNRASFGIPQGLPISGLLANLAMYRVDAAMTAAASDIGGAYRRYSDDILIIAPPGEGANLEARLKHELGKLDLRVQEAKTNRVAFDRDSSGVLVATKPLQYLGMEFDGRHVLVRSQTLVKFGKRMARAVRRARNAAKKATPTGQPVRLRRRDLYTRFSHLMPHAETPAKKRPGGSFMRYAANAGDVLNQHGLKVDYISQIRRQLRRQWSRLQRLILEAEQSTRGVRVN